MFVTTILATLFAGTLAGTAFAQDGEMPAFADVDADGNGAISQEEAATAPVVQEQWSALDVNADGQIDETEFASLKAQS